jgi:hypothetical protein
MPSGDPRGSRAFQQGIGDGIGDGIGGGIGDGIGDGWVLLVDECWWGRVNLPGRWFLLGGYNSRVRGLLLDVPREGMVVSWG